MPQIGKVANAQSPQFTLPSTTKPPSFVIPNYKDSFLDAIKTRDERIAKAKADAEAKRLAEIKAEKQRAADEAARIALVTQQTRATTVYQPPATPVQSSDYYVNWIIQHESGGDPYAVNASSGACGLFQRLPCSVTLGDVAGQMADGLAYINSRYGSPYNAYLYWIAHGNY